MNCKNCGAPMRPVDGRDYLCCDFCSTFHFPQELAESADGVKPLGQESEIECPTCAVPLSAGAVEEIRVLYCETCRGLLVDSEGFAEIIRTRRAKHALPASTPRPMDPEEFKRRVDCPACERKMEVHPYYGPGNVVIDSCCRCQVIWLDHGEIAAIQRAPGAR